MLKLPITFIIPYKKDCSDRERNLQVIVRYLLHNYDAKIIVFEADEKESISSILPKDDRLTCMFEFLPFNGVFYRTKYLNMMLEQVDTPLVANYDVDVMFDPKTIDRACSLIMNDEADVVYPFGKLEMDQFRVFAPFDTDQMINDKLYEHPHKIISGIANHFGLENCPIVENPQANKIGKNEDGFDMMNRFAADPLTGEMKESDFPEFGISPWTTLAGHCIIFRTQTYFDGYMENEQFVGWGPEDGERLHRFTTLGYRVVHLKGESVFHLEHRNPDTSMKLNPSLKKNDELWNRYKICHDEDQYRNIYESLDYHKKYKKKELV